MRLTVIVAVLLSASVLARSQSASSPPAWAYGVPPVTTSGPAAPSGRGGVPPTADDGQPKHLPDTTQAFTLQQLRDGFNVTDWYPGDHPAAPEVVMKGRRPEIRACGYCHLANGRGRPENAGLAGLPVAYFVQQMKDFKDGKRKSAEPRKTNTNLMTAYAKAMTDEEVTAAAEYFASILWPSWIRVVETETVPRTTLSGGMFVPLPGSETEPIGQRIIEMPEHPDRTELRDPRSGFVAYVPAGSIERGEALVTTGGGGRTIACGVCHGLTLDGLGPVPGLAGRSPSYMVRQLYDMQAGTRRGLWTDLMKAVVAKLTPDDMLAMAAYLASRKPKKMD